MTKAKNSFEKEAKLFESIQKLINSCDSIWRLNMVYRVWEDRMKALAAKILKPGTEEIIEEFNGGLSALDYIWDLCGDYSWSSEQTKPFRTKAIEYYLSRKVSHIWGTGIISKMKDKGFGIKVRILCGNKGCKSKMTVYFKPGCHNGAFCYAYDAKGKYLADVRNQWFYCDKCGKYNG